MRVRSSVVCAVTCLAGVLAAAVTGCGVAGASGKVAAASATPSALSASPASPTAAAAPATPAALDAQTLDTELLQVGDMPKGYVAVPSLTRYDDVALPDDLPTPVAGAQVCQVLTDTSWISASGLTTEDFAEAGYGNTARTEEISEEVDAFQGADAQKAMTGLWQALGRCATFSTSYSGMTAKITLTRSMIGGKWTGMKGVELSPTFVGATTMVAVRVGYAIVTVLDSSESNDDGSAAVSMAEKIAGRVSAAEAAK
jgi:hypothetical protein